MANVDSRDNILSGMFWNHDRCAKHNVACQHSQQTRDVAGPPSATLAQHQTSTGSMPRVCWAAFNSSWSGSAYCWRRLQADTDPMSVRCMVSVAAAGQYPFSPSQYFMLAML